MKKNASLFHKNLETSTITITFLFQGQGTDILLLVQNPRVTKERNKDGHWWKQRIRSFQSFLLKLKLKIKEVVCQKKPQVKEHV